MISKEIISCLIDRIGKFWGSRFPNSTTDFIPNKRHDSFYLIQKGNQNQSTVQIRLSNHGTYMKTWTDREELGNSVDRIDPSHSINISIVFIDDGNDITNDCEGQTNCEDCRIPVCKPQKFDGQNELGRPFKVYQYVYKSKDISQKYINALAKAIFHTRHTGQYIDPLKDLPRAASSKEFNSTNLPQDKQSRYRQSENKRHQEKHMIRLTESEFRNLITETVTKHIHLLTESQESKSIDQAKKLYMQCMNASREDARDFISKLQHDIPALRHGASKFTLGAARMSLNG